MSQDYQKLPTDIISLLGGKSNIKAAENCMTRLRIELNNVANLKKDEIKKLEGVLGVIVNGSEIQIVLGIGRSSTVTNIVKEKLAGNESSDKSKINKVAIETRKQLKDKQQKKVSSLFVKRFANIFLPIIPAFVGCGIILGIFNVINRAMGGGFASSTFGAELSIIGGLIYFGLNIFVGINTAKEFGGTPVVGGIMAALISSPSLASLSLWGEHLVPGRGGVIAVVILVIFSSWLEKIIRKHVPEYLDLFIVPTFTIFIASIAALYIIQPVGGHIADAITAGFKYLLAYGGPVAGFIMAACFLPLVMLGLHQGLIPIHAQLLQELGYNAFWPILAMSGGAQVGSAIAIYFKTKKKRLKKIILTALPVGILGVGEPLIYGVTLPLRRSFVAACIGGGFGGAIIAWLNIHVSAIGVSGVLCTIVSNKPLEYLLGLAVAYIAGFIITLILGFDDSIYADEEN